MTSKHQEIQCLGYVLAISWFHANIWVHAKESAYFCNIPISGIYLPLYSFSITVRPCKPVGPLKPRFHGLWVNMINQDVSSICRCPDGGTGVQPFEVSKVGL